ncbi:MAG: hypothetical protein AAFZ07_09700 [Actinomycetota bacterium]
MPIRRADGTDWAHADEVVDLIGVLVERDTGASFADDAAARRRALTLWREQHAAAGARTRIGDALTVVLDQLEQEGHVSGRIDRSLLPE